LPEEGGDRTFYSMPYITSERFSITKKCHVRYGVGFRVVLWRKKAFLIDGNVFFQFTSRCYKYIQQVVSFWRREHELARRGDR